MKVQEIQISKIVNNPYQTREKIQEDPLKILTKSIRERGLFSPISVLKDGDDYIIISGHRRLAAFKKLKRKEIPAIVKTRHKNKELIVDLVHENLIREDLNPIEKAMSIKLLISQIKSTQNDTGRMSSLINMLRNWKKRGYIPESRREKTKGFKDNDIFELMEILKSIGISENNAVSYLTILGLPRHMSKNIIYNKRGIGAKGKIVLKHAELLVRIKDPKYQEYLYKRAIEGASCKHINALVDLHILKVEKGEWKGLKEKTYSYPGHLKDGLKKLESMSGDASRLSSRISSFKVDTLMRLDATLEKEDFIANLTALQKELKLLDNRISEKLLDRGYKEVKDPLAIKPFEVKINYSKKKNHFRYSLPMKICRAVGCDEDKTTFLKLKIMEKRE